MIKKLYADGTETRELITKVAEQISQRIGNTIGPGGRNYMTPDGITNDGVSILDHMRFEDERMDAIADAFQEVARRQDDDAGDGTTTATLLTTALTPLVLADVMDINTPMPGMNTVMGIKATLEEELTTALGNLKEMVEPNIDLEELKKVSSTAMEAHPSSDLIAETIFEVGYNSNTSIKEGFSGTVEAKTVPGIHMPLTIETPAMYTNANRKEAVHQNPRVIVANHVFEAFTDLATYFQGMMQDKTQAKPLVIVAKQFSVAFTAQIVSVSRQMRMPILLLSAKGVTDDEFKDIAAYTGAKYIDTHPKTGVKITNLTFADAGEVTELIAGVEQTSMTGGRGIETGQVQTRIADLQELASKEQNPDQRELLKRRAAGLDGGVATIYVDAKTAVDRYYLKKKVEDTINSCKAALEHGTVDGGGIALRHAAPEEGYLAEAMQVVYNRVQTNAGGDLAIDTGVRDSYLTVKSALENAVAVAKILVTMEGVIADPDTSFVDDLSKKLGYDN
jgi:chaperonin GroEL